MKIGFFTATYYPTPDGVSHYLRDVKQELENRGHEVHIFSFNGDRHEKNVHVPMAVPFPAYPQYNMPLNPIPFHTFNLAQKVGFDVLHIHDPFMGSVGYRLARAKNLPIVATFHTDFVRMKESLKLPLKNFLFSLSWRYNSFLYRRCDRVLVPSQKTVDYLKSHGVTNTEELPLFVDTAKYISVERASDPFTVQYLGRLTRDKGVFRILDVAESMGDGKGIRFVISGTGPDEANLLREVKNRNLDDIVQLTGYVDEKRKLQLLSSANLFIYPSDTDTFGISVLEAMSSGMPAIIPHGFPLTHYDGSGDSGLIPGDFSDPSSVAREIYSLRDESGKRARLNSAARNFAKEKFSKKKHCDTLLSIYSDLIEKHRSSPGGNSSR